MERLAHQGPRSSTPRDGSIASVFSALQVCELPATAQLFWLPQDRGEGQNEPLQLRKRLGHPGYSKPAANQAQDERLGGTQGSAAPAAARDEPAARLEFAVIGGGGTPGAHHGRADTLQRHGSAGSDAGTDGERTH